MNARDQRTGDYLRTALFVDFDNVFLQLESEDGDLGKQFAGQPDRWLRWLEQYPTEGYLPGTVMAPRRILLRRVYLNPRTFHLYRPQFIRSGFEVVDCPALTTRGKTSTDIHMVMDILDAVSHSTRFDEFVIMSSDADFTPVIARLRKFDRFTLVVSLGQSAAAYRAACDQLIEQDEFIESGLGLRDQESMVDRNSPPRELGSGTRNLLVRIGAAVAQLIDSTGPLPANRLPGAYVAFPEFRASEDWLGFRSLRALTDAVVAADDNLVMDDSKDPWEVRLVDSESASEALPTETPAITPGAAEVGSHVQALVRESETPIDLARLAQRVTQRFGNSLRNDNWQGTGSFKGYLSQLPLGSIAISSVTPGYVYDPERHVAPDTTDARRVNTDAFEKNQPQVAELAQKIHYVTDMPYLTPEGYAILLSEISSAVNERGYHPVGTSKIVRDSCNGKEIPVARHQVTFVLRSITRSGHRFQRGEETAGQLGEIVVAQTIQLCELADLDLTEENRQQMQTWIMGGLETR